ncbi:hypothetical protein DO72_4430 [Burkholderia pseudomallei]|nr:hypothetical protein DO72_4430 [Burkholderia pseudomallei]
MRTGAAPETTEYGWMRSVGWYVVPHTSQLSPYWSFAWHFGHSPLMKRSGRNICLTGSYACSISRSAMKPASFSAR